MATNAKNLAELLNTDSTIAFDDAATNNFEPKFLCETKTSAFNVSASRGYFVDNSEIEQGLESGKIKIHSRIISRFETIDENGNQKFEKHTSTAGRFLLANLLPKNKDISFSLIDRVLPKKIVSEVIDYIFRFTGHKSTVIFCDKLKDLGFKHAFKAGISFGKDDLIIPNNKEQLID